MRSFCGTRRIDAAAGFASRQFASLSRMRIPFKTFSNIDVNSHDVKEKVRSALRCAIRKWKRARAVRHIAVLKVNRTAEISALEFGTSEGTSTINDAKNRKLAITRTIKELKRSQPGVEREFTVGTHIVRGWHPLRH